MEHSTVIWGEVLPYAWMVHRKRVYANTGDEQHLKLVSLESLGKIIE